MPATKTRRNPDSKRVGTVTFELVRSTKNTHRFEEVVSEDTAPLVGTLYVQKSAFNGQPVAEGTRIRATIDFI